MRRTRTITTISLSLALAAGASAGTMAADVEVVESFDAAAQEWPEGIAVQPDGSLFVTMGLPEFIGPGDGFVKSVDADGAKTTLADFPMGQGPAGIVVDSNGDVIFARANPMDEASRGVWRVGADGEPVRLPSTEQLFMPNGLALDDAGYVYASDSATGTIWRITLDGTAEPELWISDPALTGCADGEPGVNGIAFSDTGIYAAVTMRGVLVHIPIDEAGRPGPAEVVAGDSSSCEPGPLFGLDGIALSVDGAVYALLVLQHQLVRIDPMDGSIETLLTAEDGLWNPSSLAFGTADGDTTNLYLVNYAVLPPAPEGNLGPAVLKLDVGAEGRPLP